MSPRVHTISAAGFCNTCSSVRQKKPRGWRRTSSEQIPSQNGKRWETASPAEAGEGRPGISVPQQLSSTLASFQRLNPSLLQQLVSPLVTFFLPFCFPGSDGCMVQGRLLEGRPVKLGASPEAGGSCPPVPTCPAANAPCASLMLPRPEIPWGRENANFRRNRGSPWWFTSKKSRSHFLNIVLSW